MSKKRGLSLEEKREKMLQIFYDSQDFYLIYFWSLPSCAGNQLRNVTKKLESVLQSSKKWNVELVEQCESLKKGREDSDAREVALSELKDIEQKYNNLKEEMGQFADNDPATEGSY